MKEIAIVGMGKMGGAIYARLEKSFKVTGYEKKSDLAKIGEAEAVIIAVKPQAFYGLAKELKNHLNERQQIISIMAGITTGQLKQSLGIRRVIRTMPNLALSSGQSLTAFYPAGSLDKTTLELLSGWGSTLKLSDESGFDSFTALSASSPAYFLQVASHIEEAAKNAGYGGHTAQRISKNALLSAWIILEKNNDEIEKAIAGIKSQGGITEKSLAVLEKNRFGRIVKEAILAGINKSKELGK